MFFNNLVNNAAYGHSQMSMANTLSAMCKVGNFGRGRKEERVGGPPAISLSGRNWETLSV